MTQYIVTRTEHGKEWECARYDTLEAAMQHLEDVRFYPPHCRFESCLYITDDGWCGSGQDEDGLFEYNIKEEDEEIHSLCHQ